MRSKLGLRAVNQRIVNLTSSVRLDIFIGRYNLVHHFFLSAALEVEFHDLLKEKSQNKEKSEQCQSSQVFSFFKLLPFVFCTQTCIVIFLFAANCSSACFLSYRQHTSSLCRLQPSFLHCIRLSFCLLCLSFWKWLIDSFWIQSVG